MEKKVFLFPERALMEFCRQSFQRSGLREEEAELAADVLVKSDMRGVDTHGVVRLPFYCKRLIDKGTKTDPQIKILREKPAMLLIDGDNGLGQIIGIKTMKKVMEKARTSGVCFAGVRNSCHFGMAAYYAMLAIEEGMIGFAATNTPPVMAPWGGRKAFIGNNPLAIAVPTSEDFPMVLDISMSVVSGGKVRLAAVKREKIPQGWVLDGNGRPTENPDDFFPGGTLLPMGEHKGYGLAVILEMLSGVLTGAGILSEMPLWFSDTAIPTNTGHFFMAIDIDAFGDLNVFKERIHKLIHELKSCPSSEGSKEVLIPGEIEFCREQTCRKEGIPVSSEVLKNLDTFASQIGILKLSFCLPHREL